MYDDIKALPCNKVAEAEERLARRVQVSAKAQDAVLGALMKQTIVDRLVAANLPTWHPAVEGERAIRIGYGGEAYTLHPHALQQAAGVVGLPGRYVQSLIAKRTHGPPGTPWSLELLAHNLQELFIKSELKDRRGDPAKYLHRTVDGEVRGFLSRSYNRKLGTVDLLRPFLETCQTYRAQPVEVTSTDTRLSLKCMLPYIFEPVDNELIAFGVTYTNSDFGAGRATVAGTCLRLASGTLSVVDDQLSRMHLGALIDESDLELSKETEDKELAAHQSAVCDAVRGVLKSENLEKYIRLIQLAHEKEIPWYQLKRRLVTALLKTELETVERVLKGEEDIIDLPPIVRNDSEESVATAWWAASVVSHFAEKAEGERKLGLQHLAGKLVSG